MRRMICVNDKVGKLIGNNYDVTGKPEKRTSWPRHIWSWLEGWTFEEQLIPTLILVSY